jgi:hypothetical protein
MACCSGCKAESSGFENGPDADQTVEANVLFRYPFV